MRGNTIIDNTQFISNRYVPNSNQEYNEEPTGVIYKESDWYSSYFCDITNCDFINNDPENFIINNNEIVRNIINGHPLEDNYIPNYGDVSYYINGVEQRNYQLTTIPQENNDPIVKVADLYVKEGYRIYKIIINQTEESKYYYTQNFHNNAYYFLMKNYNLTVDATTPVNIGYNTTIKGKLFITDENDETTYIADEYVDLYIDGEHIGQTKTTAKGEYEFNYTTTKIGTLNITVTIEYSTTVPVPTKTTNVTVTPKESRLTIKATNNTIGETTKITFTLKDNHNKAINNAFIYFYIDNILGNGTTNSDGTITYECKPSNAGFHYVVGFYDGNETCIGSTNKTTFKIEKIKTTITVTATNTNINKETTITGKLTDEKNNPIKNTQISLLIDNKEIKLKTTTTGEFKYEQLAVNQNENYITAIFEGNEKYVNSINSTIIKATPIKTLISVTAKDVNVYEKTSITGKLTDIDKNPIKKAKVTLNIENKEVTVKTDNNGKFKYKLKVTNTGKNQVIATFDGNYVYIKSINTTNFKINKLNTKINITATNSIENKKTTIQGKLLDANNKPIKNAKVTLYYDGKEITTIKTNNKGAYSYKYTTTKEGKYDVKTSFEGNDNYLPATKTTKIKVVSLKVKTQITVKSVKADNGDTVNLEATVKDKNGKLVNKGKVIFKRNSKTIKTVNIKNGIATPNYNLGNSIARTYKITTVYSSRKYGRVQNNTNLTVKKMPTTIKAKDIVSKGNTFTIKAKILDNKNKNIKNNNKVTIKINGITYQNEVKVNKGNVNIKVPTKLNKGKYTVSILSGTNGYYASSRKDVKLTIL